MSLKGASERVKRRAKELRDEVKGTVKGLAESVPRPLAERTTILLRKPLVKMLMEKRRGRR